MNKIALSKKFLAGLLLGCASLGHAQVTFASMPKELDECFSKEANRCYSPWQGFVALQHYAPNLRAYGNNEYLYKDEEGGKNPTRLWGEDKGNDPLTHIIKSLFRSNGGNFNTDGDHDLCLGKYISGDQAPKFVAELMNYSYQKRQLENDIKKTEKDRKTFLEKLPKKNNFFTKNAVIPEDHKKSVDKIYDLNAHIQKLQKSINEKHAEYRDHLLKINGHAKYQEIVNALLKGIDGFIGTKDSEYDSHDLERAFTSFLIHKCDTPQHVLEYMIRLDDKIVDKKLLKQKLGISWLSVMDKHSMEMSHNLPLLEYLNHSVAKCLTKEDLNKEHFDVNNTDDLMMILYGGKYFDNISPYEAETLSSNGDTKALAQDGTTIAESFQDCHEIAFLHKFNQFLYSHLGQKFLFNELAGALQKKLPGWRPNAAFKKMMDFYETHQSDKKYVDQKNKAFKTAWSGVVTDLNNTDAQYGLSHESLSAEHNPQPLSNVTYVQRDPTIEPRHEVDTDSTFRNTIHVFEKILGVKLERLSNNFNDEFIPELTGDNLSNDEKTKDWIQKKMDTFLGFINNHVRGENLPQISLKDMNMGERNAQDLRYGATEIVFRVGEGNTYYDFSVFNQKSSPTVGHAWVTQKLSSATEQLWNWYKNGIQSLLDNSPRHMQFLGYVKPEALKTCDNLPVIWKHFSGKSLSNVLLYSYGYRHFNGLAMPYAQNPEETELSLYKKDHKVFVKGPSKTKLSYTWTQDENPVEVTDVMMHHFNSSQITAVDFYNLPNISSLDLSTYKNLETLVLCQLSKMGKLILPHEKQSLKRLELTRLDLENQDVDLSKYDKLQTLVLHQLSKMGKLILPHKTQSLKTFTLQGFDLKNQDVDLTDYSFKELIIWQIQNTKKLILPKDMRFLETMKVLQTPLNDQDLNLKSCSQLKEINFQDLEDVGLITLPKEANNLEKISIHNLRHNDPLDMSKFHNLKEILVSEIKADTGVVIVLPKKAPHLEKIEFKRLNLKKQPDSFLNAVELNLADFTALTNLSLNSIKSNDQYINSNGEIVNGEVVFKLPKKNPIISFVDYEYDYAVVVLTNLDRENNKNYWACSEYSLFEREQNYLKKQEKIREEIISTCM